MSPTILGHPAVVAFLLEVRDHGQRHGSRLRDLLVEHGAGGACDAADGWLGWLVESGRLVHSLRAWPSPSQAAFQGLWTTGNPGWVPGCREHYIYLPGPSAP